MDLRTTTLYFVYAADPNSSEGEQDIDAIIIVESVAKQRVAELKAGGDSDAWYDTVLVSTDF